MDVERDEGADVKAPEQARPTSSAETAAVERSAPSAPVVAPNVEASVQSLVRLGIALVALAGLASVWYVLASQSPTSAWSVASLPGPVDRFASTLATLGFGALFGAWLLPRAARSGAEAKGLVGATYLGCLLHGGASFMAALYGGYGVQLTDIRPRSVAITSVRAAGMLVIGCVLAVFLVRLVGTRRD